MEFPEITDVLVRIAARQLAGASTDEWMALSEDARKEYKAGARRVLLAERNYAARKTIQS